MIPKSSRVTLPRKRPALAPLDPPPELSIVIPVHNEEACLVPLMDKLWATLESMGETFEVIMVDDGSNDASGTLLGMAMSHRPQLRVLKLDHNCGQSAAMDCGFRHARGDVIVTLDADLQNDPSDIPTVYNMVRSGACDVACGWRKSRQDSWVRRLSSRIANRVRNTLSGESIRDTGCSLKAYRSLHLQRIKMYQGMHRFLPTLLKMEGARVAEVPVRHHPRLAGTSKYGLRNRAWRSLVDLMAICWMKNRHLNYQATEARLEACS
ncbi:MAG: glycosyltransferase family 2 protein [Planctomycetota bacterium]